MTHLWNMLAAEKLEAAEGQLAHTGRMGRFPGAGFQRAGGASSGDQQLQKISVDASKLATEQIKGISSQVGVRHVF